MNDLLYVLGIDPGFGSGGMVGVEAPAERVVFSRSLVTKASARRARRDLAQSLTARFGEDGWGDVDYTEADLQSLAWVEVAVAAIEEFSAAFAWPAYIAVESFVDQRSRARKLIKDRWKVPHAIGVLSAALAPLGYTTVSGRLVYQDAGVVLRQFDAELARLDARQKPYPDGVVVEGDSLVGNEHERRALVHALALVNHLPTLIHQPVAT
jgi:hypothetical protein